LVDVGPSLEYVARGRPSIQMPIVPVHDPADPRVDDYRSLRDRALARNELFIAESEVVLRVLGATGRYRLRSVLLAAPKLDRLAPLLARLGPALPVLVAAPGLLDGIVGFHIHRGVLAACERRPVPSAEELLASLAPGPRTVVVLEALTNHDNVGGVFRNAAAFGADGVILDPPSCDPLYRKAIRVSVGGTLTVPYARCASVGAVLGALRAAGFTAVALTPCATASDIRAWRPPADRPERVALLLGTEGTGLSPAVLAAADVRMRIAMAPGIDSLNVAAAAGIALHELGTVPRA
jgi:tRNA G18 (ribose-2'-O)-methylase SpoU